MVEVDLAELEFQKDAILLRNVGMCLRHRSI